VNSSLRLQLVATCITSHCLPVNSSLRLQLVATCITSHCLPVNSSLRLQLVATCSYLSICYIGLGALLKMLKVTICFIMSVRPSLRNKQIVFHYRNFCEIQYLNVFPPSIDIRQFSIKSDNNNRYITLRPMYVCNIILLNYF
jgi:hypothetical protein